MDIEPEQIRLASEIGRELPRWMKLVGIDKPVVAMLGGYARKIEARADEAVDKIDARAKLERVASDGEALNLMARKMKQFADELGTTADDPLVKRTLGVWVDKEMWYQENREAIGEEAFALMVANQQEVHEPDPDFVLRFHDDAQKITNEQMRELYARVLAGELARPGSIAVSTLEVLKRLDAETARLFQVWRSMSMGNADGANYVLTLGLNPSDWERFGLRFFDFLKLEESGLVREFRAVINNNLEINKLFEAARARGQSLVQLEYLNEPYYIVQTKDESQGGKKLPLVLTTNAGSALAQVVPPVENVPYTVALQRYLESQGFERHS